MFRFDLGPLLQSQTRIAKLKSAYNSYILGPRALQCETNLYFSEFWPPSRILLEMDVIYLENCNKTWANILNPLIRVILANILDHVDANGPHL